MRRIYGVRDESHRSMINRFLESAGSKLPTDLRIVCLYHRRRRSGYTEFDGWEIFRTRSTSCICRVSFRENEVTWLKRGKIQKIAFLSDYIGAYTEPELLIYSTYKKEAE